MNLNVVVVSALLVLASAFLLFVSGVIVFLYFKYLEPLFLSRKRGSGKGGSHEA